VTVTATDSLGNATTATSPVAIAAPATAGGSGTGPGTSESPVPDTTPPLFSALGLTNRVFAVARQPTAIVARRRATVKRGTVLRYTLSEASTVTLTFQHRVRVRVHRHTRLRWKSGGKLTRYGAAGANRVAFSGRIGKRALAPGNWRVVLKAVDGARNVSKTGRIGFRIVRG